MNILKNPTVLVVISLVMILMILGMRSSVKKIQRDNLAVTEAQEYVEQLNQEIADLEVKITEADTPLARERRIRDELRLQKEGEQVIVLPKISPVPIVYPTPTPTLKPIQEWWDILK